MAGFTIDWGDIQSQYNKVMESEEVKEEIFNSTSITDLKSSQEINNIAYDFINTIGTAMESSGMNSNAINSLLHCNFNSYYDKSKGQLIIKIWFENTHRESLYDKGYPEGVDDIVMLLNNGVDHTMNPVFGEWHGKFTKSKTDITGYHFLEQAKNKFISEYGAKYNIKDIVINSIDGY